MRPSNRYFAALPLTAVCVSLYSTAVFAVAAAQLFGKVVDVHDTHQNLRLFILGSSSNLLSLGPSTRPIVYEKSENISDGIVGVFSLTGLRDGEHLLELCCSETNEYPHLRVTMRNSIVVAVEERTDPLLIPGGYKREITDHVVFRARAKLQFTHNRRRWSFFSHLMKPYVIFQILAGIFVAWFPRYIATIDPQMLAQLTGEQPVDVGDANAYLKRLIDFGSDPATIQDER